MTGKSNLKTTLSQRDCQWERKELNLPAATTPCMDFAATLVPENYHYAQGLGGWFNRTAFACALTLNGIG